MDRTRLKSILEAALLAANCPLGVDKLESLFEAAERPTRDDIRAALEQLREDYAPRPAELRRVASGYRLQVRSEFSQWVSRLWEDRPPRYSRALMETLAIIAYRQPITRGEIEEIRGVSVSTNIVRTLLDRSWIRVVGHRDVPGRPAVLGTTREFLDYFGLRRLEELPKLAEIRDLDELAMELELPIGEAVEALQSTGTEDASAEAPGEADDESTPRRTAQIVSFDTARAGYDPDRER